MEMNSLQHFDKPFPLYHLSEEDHDGEVFVPKPMDKDRVMEGENWRIPRICVSDSIDGAISALVDSMSEWYGLELYVHELEGLPGLFKANKVHRPSLKQVPDSRVTGEHWVKAPAKMKKIGKIQVLDIDYTSELYYDWLGNRTKMDRFKWKWV